MITTYVDFNAAALSFYQKWILLNKNKMSLQNNVWITTSTINNKKLNLSTKEEKKKMHALLLLDDNYKKLKIIHEWSAKPFSLSLQQVPEWKCPIRGIVDAMCNCTAWLFECCFNLKFSESCFSELWIWNIHWSTLVDILFITADYCFLSLESCLIRKWSALSTIII